MQYWGAFSRYPPLQQQQHPLAFVVAAAASAAAAGTVKQGRHKKSPPPSIGFVAHESWATEKKAEKTPPSCPSDSGVWVARYWAISVCDCACVSVGRSPVFPFPALHSKCSSLGGLFQLLLLFFSAAAARHPPPPLISRLTLGVRVELDNSLSH